MNNLKKFKFYFFVVGISVFLGSFNRSSLASVSVPVAGPPLIVSGEPTTVTITTYIPDSNLILNSVNLQRLNSNGKPIAIIGYLNDTGSNGDSVAGDRVFTIQMTFGEGETETIRLRVSAAIKGTIKRISSDLNIPVAIIPVIENDSQYNQAIEETFLEFLNIKDAYMFLSQAPEYAITEDIINQFNQIAQNSLSAFMNLTSIMNFETHSPSLVPGLSEAKYLMEASKAADQGVNRIKIFSANGEDPRVSDIAEDFIEQGWQHGDLSDPEQDGIRWEFARRYESQTQKSGTTLNKIYNYTYKFSVKKYVGDGLSLVGKGIGELWELGVLGTEVIKEGIKYGVNKIIDIFIDKQTGKVGGIFIIEVANAQTFEVEVPIGIHDIIYSIEGDEPRSIAKDVPINANAVTNVTTSPGVVQYYQIAPSHTITVDDDLQDFPSADFTKIQDAVNAASPGDTISVYPGTYTENVDVNKGNLIIQSISGPGMTVFQAADSNDHVFEVTADYVKISGFTATGSTGYVKAGIYLTNASYCDIENNNISNNDRGIYLYSSSNNCKVMNNYINNNGEGIQVIYSNYSIVHNNTVSNSGWNGILLCVSINNSITDNILTNNGLVIYDSYDNEIERNTVNGKSLVYLEDVIGEEVTDATNAGQVILVKCESIVIDNCSISNTTVGIGLWESHHCIIRDNILSDNKEAIYLGSSCNNTISNNNVLRNYYPVYLDSSLSQSNNNKIYLNNFIDSKWSVRGDKLSFTNIWCSPSSIDYVYNGSNYSGYMGNYWSDYNSSDSNGDGIGDIPYSVTGNKDNYPLMTPFENYGIINGLWAPLLIKNPRETKLLQNFRNPFNPDTWIPYQLAENTDVTIRIYDVSGKLIRTLGLGHKPAGFYTSKDKAAYWNGENEAGEDVSSGVYFYSIQAGEFTAIRKMLMVK